MGIEIKELTKEQFKLKEVRNLKEDFEEIITDITSILNERMEKKDRVFLKRCLIRLQKKVTLSIEYIRYLLLTESMDNSSALRFLNSNYGKHLIKSKMAKFRRFLKEDKIEIKRALCFYSKWKFWNNELRKQKTPRFIHTFHI